MTPADYDTPAINQTAFAHSMMAALASYLDAIAVGNTLTGRAHLALAQDFVKGALKSAQFDSLNERTVAGALLEAIRAVELA